MIRETLYERQKLNLNKEHQVSARKPALLRGRQRDQKVVFVGAGSRSLGRGGPMLYICEGINNRKKAHQLIVTTIEDCKFLELLLGHKFPFIKGLQNSKHSRHHESLQWIWKCIYQSKRRVFFWLLLKDKLTTRNTLRRRNMHSPSYNCILCYVDVEETAQHLFLQCQFAQQCWQFLQVHIPSNANFPDVMLYLRDSMQSRFYMAAVILLC